MCVAEQHAPQTTFPYRKEIGEYLGGDIIGEEDRAVRQGK